MKRYLYSWLAVLVGLIALFYLLLENSRTHQPALVIGILSARENFKQRDALRNSWLRSLSYDGKVNTSVLYKFVVGSKSCNLHVANRKDRHSCEPKQFENLHKSMLGFFPLMTSAGMIKQVETIFWNATLKVHHSVTVKSLGVSMAVLGSYVRVMVYDDIRDEDLIAAFVSNENQNVSVPYFYVDIEPLMLPEGFQGSLRIVGDNLYVDKQILTSIDVTLPYTAGAVDIAYLDKSGNGHSTSDGIFLASMYLSINDAEAFLAKVSRAGSLNAQHTEKQFLINEKLIQESATYQDILLVDVIDVYRNLSDKLLQFHSWASKVSLHFVMKTDDDCYVDVEAILETLAKMSSQHKIWYGQFRHDWYVERYGKWAETSYRSSEYPAFACGSGNVVSRDISSWLADNAPHLHRFQGEDTSMGIWLSAVMPRYIEDERIQCEKICIPDAIVIPEQLPEEIVEKWNNHVQCGNPCECG